RAPPATPRPLQPIRWYVVRRPAPDRPRPGPSGGRRLRTRTATPEPPPRGRRTGRGSASVVSAKPAQRLLMPRQVLLQQPAEPRVLPPLIDQGGDRAPGNVRPRTAFHRRNGLQPLGQLRIEPQQDVLGCILRHR